MAPRRAQGSLFLWPLAAGLLAACMPLEAPPNPLLQPSCTVVYPNGLAGSAVCTFSPDSVCTSGTSLCPLGAGGYCADLQTDVSNCGGCYEGCDEGALCTDGVCACPRGQVDCNGSCVNLSVDVSNCGHCGQACGEGECNQGACLCNASPSTVVECAGTTACVDTATDPAHCGSCSAACPLLNEACTDGACACPAALPTVCPAGSFGACTNLTEDVAHCGSCDNACPANGVCQAGVCSCPVGTTLCGSTCADLANDDNNCGSCGSFCQGTCSAGSCYSD